MKRRQLVDVGRRGDVGVGVVGVRAGRVVAVDDDGVDALVHALEALDVGVDDLARARLARPDRAREVRRGAFGERLAWREDGHRPRVPSRP